MTVEVVDAVVGVVEVVVGGCGDSSSGGSSRGLCQQG